MLRPQLAKTVIWANLPCTKLMGMFELSLIATFIVLLHMSQTTCHPSAALALVCTEFHTWKFLLSFMNILGAMCAVCAMRRGFFCSKQPQLELKALWISKISKFIAVTLKANWTLTSQDIPRLGVADAAVTIARGPSRWALSSSACSIYLDGLGMFGVHQDSLYHCQTSFCFRSLFRCWCSCFNAVSCCCYGSIFGRLLAWLVSGECFAVRDLRQIQQLADATDAF